MGGLCREKDRERERERDSERDSEKLLLDPTAEIQHYR